jgi:hypothetical protein
MQQAKVSVSRLMTMMGSTALSLSPMHQQLNRGINRITEQEINGWLFVSAWLTA